MRERGKRPEDDTSMPPEFREGAILIKGKVLTKLDEMVLGFVRTLKGHADYVLVSGYVSILFGRSRGTEDVDILIQRIDGTTFKTLYGTMIEAGFHFLDPEGESDLFEMLEEGMGIRAAPIGHLVPNMELKLAKDDFDRYSLRNRVEVRMGRSRLFISPLEMQIPYKLWLGSEKDVEDALYLWDLFGDRLDRKEMRRLMDELKVDGSAHGIEV